MSHAANANNNDANDATLRSLLPEVPTCARPGCNHGRNAPHLCSRCRRTCYCSPYCQKQHWLIHKPNCRDIQALLEREWSLLPPRVEDHSPSRHGPDLAGPLVPPPPPDAPCPKCRLGKMELPVLSNCGHWVCLNCSLTLQRSLPTDVPDARGGPCPTCRRGNTQFNVPKSAKAMFELASFPLLRGLPMQQKDLQLRALQLVQAVLRLPDSDDIFDADSFVELLEIQAEATMQLNPSAGHDATPQTRLLLQIHQQLVEAKLEEATTSFEDRQFRSTILSQGAVDTTASWNQHRLDIAQAQHRLQESFNYQMFKTYVPVRDDGSRVAKAFALHAEALERSQDYTQAIAAYEDVASAPEYAIKAFLGIARCRIALDQPTIAEAKAIEAVKLDNIGKTAGTHLVLAKAQVACGQPETALRTMQHALRYEAPWDDNNHAANYRFFQELRQEEVRAEELRKCEAAFEERWGGAIALIQDAKTQGRGSWAAIQRSARFDMFVEETEADTAALLRESADRLGRAASTALEVRDDGEVVLLDEDLGDDTVIIDGRGTKSHMEEVSALAFERFKITKEVRKWWEHGDPKYKEFFLRRLRQLAAGDRSRILQKKLTGSRKTTIFETYLEQKSGFRILWTEAAEAEQEDSRRTGILVWYVSPHDRVSGYMRQIDEAEKRTLRQLTAITAVPDLHDALTSTSGDDNQSDLRHDQVMLDPFGDVPLKLFALRYEDLPRMSSSSWLPPLYLTTEERKIVELEGTILLLGRSGTGKTVCICNRIDHDRHLHEGNPTFSQLFVARSQRICAYVSDTVGSFGNVDESGANLLNFMTFKTLLSDCEAKLRVCASNEAPMAFDRSKRIDYQHFKSFLAGKECELDPLNVWTQIRSFIKGSIEAVMRRRPLTREEYLDNSVIGTRRCRLPPDQRELAYTAYEKYDKYCKGRDLWDDCDRLSLLIRALQRDRATKESVTRRRIYVDEIQDYTQAEIALFFLICDSGGLFFAGDPAQSVVEGVEFRFEEVRSVAWHLYNGDEKYIPSKPYKVTRNFRSHAGILNVAAEVLNRMFTAFPGSAKELGKDEGLFIGPRPTIFLGMNPKLLVHLIAKIQGAVLLTMSDEHVARLEALVEEGTVVLSIRDSKGLEFPDVMVVDFFRLLQAEQQKPWRLLLQGKDDEARELPGFPELEVQLKQLYTAITRCSKRLFFVETEPSDAGQAFARFLCSEKKLAIKENLVDVQEIIRTTDEWSTTGVQYGSNAETAEDANRFLFWLDKALYCFQQAKDKDLERKVQVHRSSIALRTKLETSDNQEQDEGRLELEIAQQFKKLGEEGLLMEARRLYDVAVNHLSDFCRSALQQRLFPLLPELDDY